MDTSKDYYESVMRDFKTYGRGRTLEQYCRDEAVDYKWIEKAKEQYGATVKTKGTKTDRKDRTKSTDMIQLHFEAEAEQVPATEVPGAPEAPAAEEGQTSKPRWRVASLKVMTPLGHEIEIVTSNPSAVSELLSQLSA